MARNTEETPPERWRRNSSPERIPFTETCTSSCAMIFSTQRIILMDRVRLRNTRRMISVTRWAARFTSPATTTRIRAKHSSSGRRNGGWNAFPIRSISRFHQMPREVGTSATYARVRIVQTCPAAERRLQHRWIPMHWPSSLRSTRPTARLVALRRLVPATTPTSYNPLTGVKNFCEWTTTSPATCAACFITSTTPGIRLRPRRCGPTRRCLRFRRNLWVRQPARSRGWCTRLHRHW